LSLRSRAYGSTVAMQRLEVELSCLVTPNAAYIGLSNVAWS
jgi:hypothetical protein